MAEAYEQYIANNTLEPKEWIRVTDEKRVAAERRRQAAAERSEALKLDLASLEDLAIVGDVNFAAALEALDKSRISYVRLQDFILECEADPGRRLSLLTAFGAVLSAPVVDTLELAESAMLALKDLQLEVPILLSAAQTRSSFDRRNKDAYGYGLNMMSDSAAGWALVESLTNGRCEVLSRSGQDHRLAGLLEHPKLYFWGDLDREGLRIAIALRSKFPHLKLSGFYNPMVALARNKATSHPYALFCGKANQQPWRHSGDVQLDALAAVCESRAVDQEAVDLCLHAGLVAEVLSMAPESIQE